MGWTVTERINERKRSESRRTAEVVVHNAGVAVSVCMHTETAAMCSRMSRLDGCETVDQTA